jgi:hypothetical protein
MWVWRRDMLNKLQYNNVVLREKKYCFPFCYNSGFIPARDTAHDKKLKKVKKYILQYLHLTPWKTPVHTYY